MDPQQLALVIEALRQPNTPIAPAAPKTLAELLRLVNMQQRNQGQPEAPMGPVRIEGGGSVGQGILSGGGRATYEMPNTLQGILSMYAGGGGAIGSVNTPEGRQRIREFGPEIGLGYQRRF